MSREILIPDYFRDFSCLGASCDDTCCAGWKVTVDKTTYRKYRNIKNPEIKEQLKKYITRERSSISSDIAYGKIKMNEKNTCPLLTEEGWCRIHAELGEEFLCNTCTVYPRSLKEVDNRIEKSLALSCPEAARLVLLNEAGIEFIIDEEETTNEFVEERVQTKNKHYFWELRMFTIEMLQNRKQAFDVRLIVLGLFFSKITEMPIKDWSTQLEPLMNRYRHILDDNEQIQLLMNLPENLSFQINMARELLNYRIKSGISSQRYLDCVNDMLNALKLQEETNINESVKLYKRFFAEYFLPFMKNHEYILENYAVNYVFKNLFPYDHPNLFESYVMLSLNISIIKLHLIGMAGKHKGLTIELVIKLFQSYAKIIEHNATYLQSVRNLLKESGYSTMAHMIVLLKS